MSFKGVRDFSENLKLLGYSNVFPLQSLAAHFGSIQSFKVVVEILQWLACRFEPGTTLPGGYENEGDRILFIRSSTEFFVTKSGIKLNPRKLYVSSSATAIELQSIVSLLMATSTGRIDADEENGYSSLNQVDIGDKIEELRRARELSSELTNQGAILYDLLCKELNNKEARLGQSTRPLEISSVEGAVKNAIGLVKVKLQSAKTHLENAKLEKNSLRGKLQRKAAELERSKQRLDALQKIRPAYLQEFEQYENELRELFQQYFQRVKCRDALKTQLEMRMKAVSPMSTPIIKPSDSSISFIPDGLIVDDEDDEDDMDFYDYQIRDISDENLLLNKRDRALFQTEKESTSRVRPTTGRQKPRTGTTIGRQKVIGSMLGNPDDEGLDSTLGSSESEEDAVEAPYDLNTDDDISISKLTGTLPLRPKTANKVDHHSDDDF